MTQHVPTRLFLDLPAAPASPSFDHLGLCEEVVALQVPTLHVRQRGDLLSAPLLEVAEKAAQGGVALHLTLSAEAVRNSLPILSRLHVRKLVIVPLGAEDLAAVPGSFWQRDVRTAVSFEVGAHNSRDLPAFITCCAELGVRELQLTVGGGVAGRELHFLGVEERELLAAAVRGVKIPSSLTLAIDDPILWQIFFPERTFPRGGCQGGGAILYVAPDGEVYPCPSLPFPLGNVAEKTLSSIMRSPQREEVRDALRKAPAACDLCGALPHCLGGCRGRGYLAGGSFDAADPACFHAHPVLPAVGW